VCTELTLKRVRKHRIVSQKRGGSMEIKRTMWCVVMVHSLLFAAPGAWAQSALTGTIAGVAKDATGGVLPGVGVEVASPGLIEKVRTAVTDDLGVIQRSLSTGVVDGTTSLNVSEHPRSGPFGKLRSNERANCANTRPQPWSVHVKRQVQWHGDDR
jgi:hypothetical protein